MVISLQTHESLKEVVLPPSESVCGLYSLIVELDDLIAILLQVVQMFNFIFVTLYGLSVSFLQVHIFDSKQLLFVIKDLVDLKEEATALAATRRSPTLKIRRSFYLARSSTPDNLKNKELLALNGDGFIG